MAVRIKTEKLRNNFLYVLLFLAAMNFKAKFFYFVFIAFFMILVKNNIKIDNATIIYLSLGILMAGYNYDEGVLSMIRCFAPLCFYLVGVNIIPYTDKNKIESDGIKDAQKHAYMLITMISLGSFMHYFLNYLYNMNRFIGRNTLDIWSGQIIAATGQNAMTCIMLGLAVAMMYLPLKEWHRYAAVGCIVIMLLYNLTLASRTLIVIMIILVITAWGYTKKVGCLKVKRGKKNKRIFWIFVAIFVVYAVKNGDLLNIVSNSMLTYRLGGSIKELFNNSSRTSAKAMFISEMLDYPFGGLNMSKKYGFAHDLILDGYDEYGFLILFILIPMLITGVIQLYKLLRYSDYTEEIKLPLLLINISILLEFTVEPILTGMPWLLACYCLLNGCMTRMNRIDSFYKIRRISEQNEGITNKHGIWQG